MELISINYLQHQVNDTWAKYKSLKPKINHYFASFFDQHRDIDYYWFKGNAHIDSAQLWTVKKELEKMASKQLKQLETKHVDYELEPIDFKAVKEKIVEKKNKQLENADQKRKELIADFKRFVADIEQAQAPIGALDLEFWELDSDKITEFGWTILNPDGTEKTEHLIVRNNIDLHNGIYAKGNKYARKDSKIYNQDICFEKMESDFLKNLGGIIGVGLATDIRVMKRNSYEFKHKYIDLADIGAALFSESDSIGMERLLQKFSIPGSNLHNAANDTECIIQIYKAMVKMVKENVG